VANIQNNRNGFITYAILNGLKLGTNYVVKNVTQKYLDKQSIIYQEKQIQKYNSLTLKSKKQITIESFTTKLKKSTQAQNHFNGYVLSTTIGLLSSMVAFVIIVIKNKQYGIFVSFIIIHLLWYYIVTKNSVEIFNKFYYNNRKTRNVNDKTIMMLFGRIMFRECTVDKIISNYEIINDNNYTMHKKWMIVSITQQIPNVFIMLLIALYAEVEYFMVLFVICNNVTKCISTFTDSLNVVQTLRDDIYDMDMIFNDTNEEVICTQHKIPENLCVKGSVQHLKISPKNKKGIKIRMGDKIRVTGRSGAGKTTLVSGLLGEIKGIKYSSGKDPLSYSKKITYMSQNIKDSFKITGITIRQIFYDECDDELIINAFKVVNLYKWFIDRLKSNFESTINDNDISGGEKMRLCIATTIYLALKNKSQYIIFDEPTEGIDIESVPIILQNIINTFEKCTVFFITHVCDCLLKNVDINKRFHIENGIVREVKL
jgi:ABC-type bacteriocin/lantibiotic exporter with double-glycine peptidase domain